MKTALPESCEGQPSAYSQLHRTARPPQPPPNCDPAGTGNDSRSNRTAGACSVSSGSSHPGLLLVRHCLLVRCGGPPVRYRGWGRGSWGSPEPAAGPPLNTRRGNHSAASNCCPEKLLQNRSRETEFASSEAGEPVQYFTSKSAVFDWTVPVQKRTRRMPGVSRLMNVGPLPSNREVTR